MLKTTPLEQLHIQFGADFKEYHGWSMPYSYTMLETELAGLVNSSAAFDLCAFGRIAVSGSGAEDVVKAALPMAEEIAENHWGWASDYKQIRLVRTANEYLVLLHPLITAETAERIANIAKGLNASVTDRTEKTAMIGIYGPQAYETLSRIIPLDVSMLDESKVLSLSFFMMSFTVIRGSWLGIDGVELICPVNASKFATQAIEKYHNKENIIPAGMKCFDTAFNKYVDKTESE